MNNNMVEIFRTRIIPLYAHRQVLYSNCVKFPPYWFCQLSRICAYKTFGQIHGQTRWILYTP